jgi:3-mercaptopyruvate sulfurtransferase SseA
MSRLKKALWALAAVTLTVGTLWQANRQIAPKKATWQDVLAEASQGGYRLIDTNELSNTYQAKTDSMLLVDTRQEWEYRTGHIRGAVNFPIEPTWLSRWRNKGALQKLLGPDKSRLIVFY